MRHSPVGILIVRRYDDISHKQLPSRSLAAAQLDVYWQSGASEIAPAHVWPRRSGLLGILLSLLLISVLHFNDPLGESSCKWLPLPFLRGTGGIIRSCWALLGTPGTLGAEGTRHRAQLILTPRPMPVELPGVISWVPIIRGWYSGLPILAGSNKSLGSKKYSFSSKKLGCVASLAGVVLAKSFSGTALTACFSPKPRSVLSLRNPRKETLLLSSSPLLPAVEEEPWILPFPGSCLLDVYCSWPPQPNASSWPTRVT